VERSKPKINSSLPPKIKSSNLRKRRVSDQLRPAGRYQNRNPNDRNRLSQKRLLHPKKRPKSRRLSPPKVPLQKSRNRTPPQSQNRHHRLRSPRLLRPRNRQNLRQQASHQHPHNLNRIPRALAKRTRHPPQQKHSARSHGSWHQNHRKMARLKVVKRLQRRRHLASWNRANLPEQHNFCFRICMISPRVSNCIS